MFYGANAVRSKTVVDTRELCTLRTALCMVRLKKIRKQNECLFVKSCGLENLILLRICEQLLFRNTAAHE